MRFTASWLRRLAARTASLALLFFIGGAFAQSSFPPAPAMRVAVNPITNKVYIANESANTVTVLDAAHNTTATIPVGPRPLFIAVNPATNRVYVNNAGDTTVSVIDGDTDTNLTPGASALALGTVGPIAINPVTNIIYIVRLSGTGSDEVTFLNGATNVWYTIATDSFQPIAVAVNPVTNRIYVAHYATGDVRIISGAYSGIDFPATVSRGMWSHPFALAANPVTNKVYVITEDSRGPIGVLDGATNGVVFPAPASGHAVGPKSIAVNPVTNRVYAAFTNEVIVIDGATNTLTYIPVDTGAGVVGLAVDHSANRIYVAADSGTLTVIDGDTNTTTTRAIGAGATGLALNPVTHKAYVSGPTTSVVDVGAGTTHAVPLTASIAPLPGDSASSNATFTITANNGFSPNALAVRAVYYQLDSTGGAWTKASGSGPYTASFTGLAGGTHTLYAFAADGQDAPLANGPQSSPLVGAMAAYTFSVSRATATVSLASSKNPSTSGESVTFTASVSGSGATPTGTVDFLDGTSTLAGCAGVALSGGSASCTSAALSAGSHSITARYSGDSTYGVATSSAVSQTVNPAKVTPTVALSSSANPSTTGSNVTFTATITGSAGAATGTVSFTDGGTAIGGCTSVAVSGGAAACTTNALTTGAHTIVAQYSGNTAYNAASSAGLAQTVTAPKVTPTVALASSANPSLAGSNVTFTATITGSAGAPTGTVTFTDGGTAIGGCVSVAVASGAASCTTGALATGSHAIVAQYSGNTAYDSAASSTLTQTVNAPPKAAPSVALVSSKNPTLAGESVTFTATVGGSAGAGTGTVDFTDSSVSVGGCAAVAISGGVATCTTAALSIGTHSIVARYSGNSAYDAGNSSAVAQTVNATKSTPSVALTSSRNPSNAGESVTFTATVGGGTGAASGTVTFNDGGTAIAGCSGVALSGGAAACTTASLAAGSHSIVARYSGDANYDTNTSSALSQTVDTVKVAAAVALASSRNPSTAGENVTFTATVSGGAGTATGSVTFTDGGSPIAGCGALALAGGAASCATAGLASGTHGIVAQYSGDGVYNPAQSGALSQVVDAPPPSATAKATLAPNALDFGGASMGTTSLAKRLTLTNSGTGTLNVAGISLSTTEFQVAHDCGALAPGASCTLAVTFNPASTDAALNGTRAVTGTLAVTSNSVDGTATASLSGVAQKSLVTHYYEAILGRTPDAGGLDFWQGEAARVVSLGMNVNEAWYAMASGFYSSAEYEAFRRDDAAFVGDLYETFFNRAADPGGLQFWTQQLAAGVPRQVVLLSFMFSPEFTTFSRSIFGDAAARPEVDMVGDFYRGALSRLPDSGGFDFWVGQFRKAQCQGSSAVYGAVDAISSAFLSSGEYAARARTNSQFVGDLYNAFLRRGGDAEGVRYWIDLLDRGGQTREQVRQQFLASAEFNNRALSVAGASCMP